MLKQIEETLSHTKLACEIISEYEFKFDALDPSAAYKGSPIYTGMQGAWPTSTC